MEISEFDAEYTYDYDLDIVNIKVKKDYTYEESVDLETGVFLDFDKDMFPVNLEILSASKRIDVEKEFLTNPDGDVKIVIESDLIQLEICFKNNDEEHILKYCNRHEDNLKIENLKTIFALV